MTDPPTVADPASDPATPDRPQLTIERMIDLLAEALAAEAADPPPTRDELLTLLDHFDRYVSSPDQTGYVGTPFWEQVQTALADLRASGSAPNPQGADDRILCKAASAGRVWQSLGFDDPLTEEADRG